MPRSSEFHIAPGHTSGRIRSPALGGVGEPSAYASTEFSRRTSYPLKGALDPDCDDETFDCPGKEMEEEMEEEVNEKNESLIREFVRSILILDGVTLSMNPTSHPPMPSGPAASGTSSSSTVSFKTHTFDHDESEGELIDEDELEEEDEVEEVNAIGMGGGTGVSRGTVRGVTLPLGMSPPSHGRKRRTPAAAAGSGFGGAKPYMPGKRKKGKKSRKTNK